MTPSVVAAELVDTVLDYIHSTLDLEDPDLTDALDAHLRGDHGLFRGPYVRIGLPFQVADDPDTLPLSILPPFTPYAHQATAFRQLFSEPGNPDRANTLVTTGTGSGKTECFLFPVLDHCWRHRHEPGIKAILLYPMNALATDQARRLAELIHADERLKDLRAGLFVGGDGERRTMEPDALIDHKDTLRDEPPDILLTNYKMLDFLLMRPRDRALWASNGPETLQFLCVDELHTFDGAQGSDVACLIRRLKARLHTPDGHLLCAGTSATIGSSTDEATFTQLADFATTVFGEPFTADRVVRESRVRTSDFLQAPVPRPIRMTAASREQLRPRTDDTGATWRARQLRFWLGDVTDPVAIGTALLSHQTFHALLREARGVQAMDDLRDRVFKVHAPADGDLLLQSFLGVVSVARRLQGTRPMPLVTLQLQLWCRELRRLLRVLPHQVDGFEAPIAFSWHTDTPTGRTAEELLTAPQAHCRECGIAGFAARMPEGSKGRLAFGAADVGRAWQTRNREARFVWPRPVDAEEREGQLVHWLDPVGGVLNGSAPAPEPGEPAGLPVVVEGTLRGDPVKRFAARCPACGVDDALSIMGARAASLSGVVVSQLYQSDFQDDDKLLAFTDSVQDAAHRAGFFNGRTYRIHLRTAIQHMVREMGPVRLSEAAKAFESVHRTSKGKAGAAAFLAQYLPPDLAELPSVLAYRESEGAGSHKGLWSDLRARLQWEITREYGLAAGIGRSLERSAASGVLIDAERFDRAAATFTTWLQEQRWLAGEADPALFLFGIVHRLRQRGGIYHPFLARYIQSGGRRYMLGKGREPRMSPVGPRTKRIRFLVDSERSETFDCPFGKGALRGWFGDWMKRALDWDSPGIVDLAKVYRKALDDLLDAEILEERAGKGRDRVMMLRPDALWLTTDIAAVVEGTRRLHLGRADAERCDGRISMRFRSPRRVVVEDPEVGFYARVYNRSSSIRVQAAEHTGLLSNDDRTLLEARFKTGTTAADPTAPNLLTCTPTLEMGVDIGDLSAVLLCSIPPTPASYLQRVGRAGRKTGNALVFALATSQPHDMHFHAEPPLMLDGAVLPPGAYLGATAMLQRQLVGWCMDAWARDDTSAPPIPGRVVAVLGDTAGALFPGRFLEYVAEHRPTLWAGFLEVFGEHLTDDGRDTLHAYLYAQGDAGLIVRVQRGFDGVKETLATFDKQRRASQRRIKQISEDRTSVADADLEIRDLKRHIAVVNRLTTDLRSTYPLNVLTDRGVLPNYAFPESGVTLQAVLVHRDTDDVRNLEKRKYVRPAARALRELAPFATFYAEGHKLEISSLELGPSANHVEYWRFCARCHEVERQITQDARPTTTSCPSCGDERWADKGQIHAMLPLRSVRSTSDRVRSAATDALDERERESYQLQTVFQVPPQSLRGAWWIPSQGFGFEALENVRMTEINLGLTNSLATGTRMEVAGALATLEGFETCRDCGEVREVRPHRTIPGSTSHAPFCPQRKADTKPREQLFLYREVQSEAIRFLLPFSQIRVSQRLASFTAAIDLGLRRRFQGRPIHLSVTNMSEPDPADPERRKHFLVLFDTVPGGTGYLRDFQEPGAIFHLLEAALDAVVRCGCREQGRDGCYACLFAHGRQRDLPFISSQEAENTLKRILAARAELLPVAGGLSPVHAPSTTESELEERFLERLENHYGQDLGPVRFGRTARLQTTRTLWEVASQVDLTDDAGQPSIADFVLTAVKGAGLDRRVVVECDGAAYHICPGAPTGRVAADLAKRTALIERGHAVFSLTWNDLVSGRKPGRVPRAFLGNANRRTTVRKKSVAEGELPFVLDTLSGLELFLAFLDDPEADWERRSARLVGESLIVASLDKRVVPLTDARQLEQRLAFDTQDLPDDVATGVPRRGEPVASALFTPYLRLVARADLSALKRFTADMSLIVRLDDRFGARSDEAFADDWRTTLQLLNATQFLRPEVVTTEQLDAVAMASEGPAIAAESVDPPAVDDALDRLLELVYEESLHPVLRALWSTDLPRPDEDAVGIGDALPEVTWSDRKVAVFAPDTFEPQDLAAGERDGWTLLIAPVTLDLLTPHLRRSD
jgi:DEAD/DEAH box helicase domain-containing protein